MFEVSMQTSPADSRPPQRPAPRAATTSARRSRRPWWILALVLAVFAAGAWLLLPHDDAVRYRTATVDTGSVRVAIAATGKLSALSTVEVGSQVSGQVLTVEVDFNDRVEANQPIARINPANFRSRLEQAQADLTSAQANLDAARANHGEAQATLKNAEATFERTLAVWERRLIARADYDTAVAARDQALARVASTAAAVKVAQSQVAQRAAAVENAQLELDYTIIRSPVDGVVLLRAVQPGQTVAASFQTPVLFSIAEDLGKMQIELTVDESDVGQIREGQAVRFTVDAFPGREFEGRVRQVRLAATETSTVITYPVIVDVDNSDGTLLPGMTASAEVLVSERTGVLRLPNAALRYRPADAPAAGGAGGAGGPGAGAGSAGGPPSPEAIARMREQAQRQTDELAQRLELDAAQRATLDEAMNAMRQQMRGQMQAQAGQAPASEGARRRRMADAYAAALQPLRAQLRPEQQARLDEELALMANSRRAEVWVLRDGVATAVPVRIGLADNSHSELLSGLAEGDAVITGVERSGP
jgi:HlyD family secretion protein